jgi:hypothetical protein
VAVKCKNADGIFETKALGEVDKSGAFSVPLAADLLRADGELKQDCFAQLHNAANQPCPGQEPSWIVRPSSDGDDDKKKTFVAVAGKMHYSSKECASAFLCDHFHKKHKHLFHKKPVMIPHIPKKPIVIPHFHNKPVPEHKPPTPVPVYHAPVPEYNPPTPVPVYHSPVREYSHPTPIYHPPADQKTQNPETETQRSSRSSSPSSRRTPSSSPSSASSLLARWRSRLREIGESRSIYIVGFRHLLLRKAAWILTTFGRGCSLALTGLDEYRNKLNNLL